MGNWLTPALSVAWASSGSYSVVYAGLQGRIPLPGQRLQYGRRRGDVRRVAGNVEQLYSRGCPSGCLSGCWVFPTRQFLPAGTCCRMNRLQPSANRLKNRTFPLAWFLLRKPVGAAALGMFAAAQSLAQSPIFCVCMGRRVAVPACGCNTRRQSVMR